MEDRHRDALLELFSRPGKSWPREEDAAARGLPGLKSQGEDPLEWVAILSCLRRIRRWRVPPHWSDRDWFEEIGAEATAAAVQAARDFDPTRGVPWEAFLRQRVVRAALARYRREWTFAIRRVSAAALDEYGAPGRMGLPSREAIAQLLQEALKRLPQPDAWLIEGLFWEGKTEAGLAACLGITQQAVNKRKRTIYKTLHRLIDTLAKNSDSWL